MRLAQHPAGRLALAAPGGWGPRAGFIAVMCLASLAPRAALAADMNAVNNAAKIATGVASNVGAGTAVPSLGVGAVLQTIVALVVVIGIVFACAWLARRFGLQPSSRGGHVKVVAGTSLGGKERVAVVEIGDTWLVLGAAPGNVRLLHTMPAGSASAEGAAGFASGSRSDSGSGSGMHSAQTALTGTFGQRFRSALMSEASKRFQRRESGDK